MPVRTEDKVRCSFCGKSQQQVRKLIAGPNGAYICDECVEICAEIIDEELEEAGPREHKGGAPDFEINLLTPEEMKELAAAADIYRKYHRDVIANGTLYHLCAPHEGNYMCMQCVSADGGASLVLFMNKLKEQDVFRFVRLKGLDEKKRYRNTLDEQVHTGEYYMRIGLNLSRYWPQEFSHRLILLTEEK